MFDTTKLILEFFANVMNSQHCSFDKNNSNGQLYSGLCEPYEFFSPGMKTLKTNSTFEFFMNKTKLTMLAS